MAGHAWIYFVAEYLFEYEPGMFWAGDFRHEWAEWNDVIDTHGSRDYDFATIIYSSLCAG